MIHQYFFKLDNNLSLEKMNYLMQFISSNRQKKINNYMFQIDKKRSLIAELLVRYGLIKDFGISNNSICFINSNYGKPQLLGENIYFNISHSGQWIVCAIGDVPLGIDIEEVKSIDIEPICNTFSLYEKEFIESIKFYKKNDAFFKLWTLKESFVKYIGLGLLYSFDQFSVDLLSLDLYEREKKNCNISLYSEKIDNKYWYAVCSKYGKVRKDKKYVCLEELISLKQWKCEDK